jgi:hypothetical protein
MRTSGLSLDEDVDWRDYCSAARRKVEISEYHLLCLRDLDTGLGLEPTIPVQAHLEGILFAFVAAADQTAQSINLGFRLQLDKPTLGDVFRGMPRSTLKRRLCRWHDAPTAADARD